MNELLVTQQQTQGADGLQHVQQVCQICCRAPCKHLVFILKSPACALQVNARKIYGEPDVLQGLGDNRLFLYILGGELALQVLQTFCVLSAYMGVLVLSTAVPLVQNAPSCAQRC